MKKTLSIIMLSVTSLVFAQVLDNQNFNSLTAGNLSTNINGSSPGQAGYYVYSNSATVSDIIVETIDANHANSLSVKSIPSGTGTNWIYKTGLDNAWLNRTPGNNIIKVSMEMYTGSMANNVGYFRSDVYGQSNANILCGILFDYNTGKLFGVAYYGNGTAPDNYAFALGQTVYPQNTWIKLSYTYDKTTGKISWTTPNGFFEPMAPYTPVYAGKDPVIPYFIHYTSATNNSLIKSSVDNFKIEAINVNLSTSESTKVDNSLVSIYPNPTSDFINWKSSVKINSVEVLDVTGKVLKTNLKDNKIDVSDLVKGNYILKIKTEIGSESKKFLKK